MYQVEKIEEQSTQAASEEETKHRQARTQTHAHIHTHKTEKKCTNIRTHINMSDDSLFLYPSLLSSPSLSRALFLCRLSKT